MKRILPLVSVPLASFALGYLLYSSLGLRVVLGGRDLPHAPFMLAVLTSVLIGAACVAWQTQVSNKKRDRIKVLFGSSLSPGVVEQMVKSGIEPQLGGHQVEITPFFSSVQNFAISSESLPPHRLLELMSDYLTACTDIIQQEGGTLDKYIGDAVIAMFGTPGSLPDHAFRACVAAQRIQLKLGDLRDKWRREGDRWPSAVSQLRTSIGLNTGPCIVGNLGSRTRFNYTMMGDNVNLAARLNFAGGSWGANAACTEATRVACQQHGGDRVIFRPLGRVSVKGRPLPVPIHEIVGLKESIETSTRECIGLFELGLARYYSRDWDGAISQFQQSARLEPLHPDRMPGVRTTPSLVFLGYCQQFKSAPPPDEWNGVFVVDPR